MLRLTYSNQTERLLEALAERIAGERAIGSPLDPIHLVVPNGNVESWVKLELARTTGIAVNLEVRYLRRFFSELISHAAPEVRLLDAPRLEGLLLGLFHDDALVAEPALDEVRRYLLSGSTGSALDLRRVQLARELAVIFDEYTLSRPELLDAWLRGRSGLAAEIPNDADALATERWQARLWRAIAAPDGLAARRSAALGQRWPTLPALLATLDPARLPLPAEVHVFGLSYVARTFHRLFALLARHSTLSIYTLNPCMELWEDLDAHDTPALRLWGRPGREHVRLLNELSDCDFQPRFVDPTEREPTLLTLLQRDILTREPERKTPAAPLAPADDSVRIFACPSVRREAEIIAAEIWRLAEADPTLRWNEVAVIVPGAARERYQTHLAAAFSEMHGLPSCVADLPLAQESRLFQAIDLLLDLPLGELKRRELLELMIHPQVMARFPDASAEEWVGWCETLGIVHGADRDDHTGTYIDRDLVNWEQGIRRLALGAFMTGGQSALDRPLFTLVSPGRRDEDGYLPEEVHEGQVASAGAFALLARSLTADARFARDARLPLADWLRLLRRQIATYFTATSDEDERALARVRDALAGLDDRALALGDVPISYRVACELERAVLGGLSASRGQVLAGGVMIASFLPMRAIPFRAVFLAGLGEGQFPAGERPNPLDLRLARRRAGDVTPREQDRYLFLETLLCARGKIVLSYVDRAPLTGDRLAPSSVVVELAEMIERGYLAPGDRERLYRSFELKRHEDEHTRRASPAAAREAKAARLGAELDSYLGEELARPDPATLIAALPAPIAARISAGLDLCPAPEPAPPPERLTLSVSALRRFLECPLQGAARTVLGLRDDEDDDPIEQEDEPFTTPRLPLLMGLRDLFQRTLSEPGSARDEKEALISAYERFRRVGEHSGLMPFGPFGEIERASHLRALATWLAQLRSVAAGPPGARLRMLRFGAAEEQAAACTPHPPVTLTARLPGTAGEVAIELTGQSSPLLGSAGTFWLVQHKIPTGIEAVQRDGKESLRGFLDHVLLSAAGLASGEPFTAHVANAPDNDEPRLQPTHFSPIAPEKARAYLGELASELLSGPHDYLLPSEAVFQRFSEKAARPFGAIVDELCRNDRVRFSSTYGPVPHPRSYPPPSEERAEEMIARRFGLYRESLR